MSPAYPKSTSFQFFSTSVTTTFTPHHSTAATYTSPKLGVPEVSWIPPVPPFQYLQIFVIHNDPHNTAQAPRSLKDWLGLWAKYEISGANWTPYPLCYLFINYYSSEMGFWKELGNRVQSYDLWQGYEVQIFYIESSSHLLSQSTWQRCSISPLLQFKLLKFSIIINWPISTYPM